MISKKTKYALKSLIFLAKKFEQGPVLIGDLAKSERIPQKFLEAILLELKNHGLLESKRGKGGGYYLLRHPREVKIGQVLRLFEGPLAPVSCVSQTAYRKCSECKNEHQCEIRLIMKEVRDAMSKILDQTSLLDLIERSQNVGSGNLNYII